MGNFSHNCSSRPSASQTTDLAPPAPGLKEAASRLVAGLGGHGAAAQVVLGFLPLDRALRTPPASGRTGSQKHASCLKLI